MCIKKKLIWRLLCSILNFFAKCKYQTEPTEPYNAHCDSIMTIILCRALMAVPALLQQSSWNNSSWLNCGCHLWIYMHVSTHAACHDSPAAAVCRGQLTDSHPPAPACPAYSCSAASTSQHGGGCAADRVTSTGLLSFLGAYGGQQIRSGWWLYVWFCQNFSVRVNLRFRDC